MLSNAEKEEHKRLWLSQAAFFGKPLKPCAPKIGCVYAFEMSNGTVKIGISKDSIKRSNDIRYSCHVNVLRIYQTEYAPLKFIRKIESACHSTFANKRVHGEFFDITFDEACAELNRYSNRIITARTTADERLLDEINYFFYEFLPEFTGFNPPKPQKKSQHVLALELQRARELRRLADRTDDPNERERLIGEATKILSSNLR